MPDEERRVAEFSEAAAEAQPLRGAKAEWLVERLRLADL